MLPDYPKFKKNLEDILVERFRIVSDKASFPMVEIRQQRIFEGQSEQLLREHGTKEEIEMHLLSEDMIWKYEEVETLTLERVIELNRR